MSQTSGLDIERAGLTLADQEHEEIATSLLETATSGRGKSREKERERKREGMPSSDHHSSSRLFLSRSKQQRNKNLTKSTIEQQLPQLNFIRPLQAGIQVAVVAVAATAAATLPSLPLRLDRTHLLLPYPYPYRLLLFSSSSPPTASAHSPNCPTSSQQGGTRSRPSTCPRPCRACEFESRP